MIKSVGLFWSKDDIFWGAGRQPGKLLGVPATNITATPIDFREQIGIYALYSGYQLLYVGQAGKGFAKLFNRLKNHRKGNLADRWDRFSWYGLRKVLGKGRLSAETEAAHPEIGTVLNHMEAILIHAAEPPLNRQGGKFGEDVILYRQKRDERLGPTVDEMVKELWEDSQ